MVKFALTAPLEVAVKLVNRVVCDVCEYRHTHPVFGPFVVWRGSVAEEWFTIMFMRGILTISLAERECQVGENIIHYAMSEVMAKCYNTGKNGATPIGEVEAVAEYLAKTMPKEIAEISFTDVMVVLNWKYSPNAKIDYDLLGD